MVNTSVVPGSPVLGEPVPMAARMVSVESLMAVTAPVGDGKRTAAGGCECPSITKSERVNTHFGCLAISLNISIVLIAFVVDCNPNLFVWTGLRGARVVYHGPFRPE